MFFNQQMKTESRTLQSLNAPTLRDENKTLVDKKWLKDVCVPTCAASTKSKFSLRLGVGYGQRVKCVCTHSCCPCDPSRWCNSRSRVKAAGPAEEDTPVWRRPSPQSANINTPHQSKSSAITADTRSCAAARSDLRVQLHYTDVVVHHRPVVARVYDDGAHPSALTVTSWVVQVVNAQHHLPQVCTLSPVTHTHR